MSNNSHSPNVNAIALAIKILLFIFCSDTFESAIWPKQNYLYRYLPYSRLAKHNVIFIYWPVKINRV